MSNPDVDDDIALDRRLRLDALRDCLYAMPDCECGGPLHVVLDDGNLEDEHLTWSLAQMAAR